MTMMEAVQEGIKTLVLPELKTLSHDLAGVKTELARQAGQLDATNHRLSDMHDHLVLLSQRQDELRRDFDTRFDRITARIDTLVQTMVKPDDFAALRQRVDRVEGHVRRLRKASGE